MRKKMNQDRRAPAGMQFQFALDRGYPNPLCLLARFAPGEFDQLVRDVAGNRSSRRIIGHGDDASEAQGQHT